MASPDMKTKEGSAELIMEVRRVFSTKASTPAQWKSAHELLCQLLLNCPKEQTPIVHSTMEEMIRRAAMMEQYLGIPNPLF